MNIDQGHDPTPPSDSAHATTAEHRKAFASPPAGVVEHDVILRGPRVLLRPLTERDWVPLLAWNNDPEVLYFADGGEVQSRTLDEVQDLYRAMSANATCFVIELDGEPIGECWLQRMNLVRMLERHPGADVRRIEIAIGVPTRWGQGLGTEAVRLLVDFGFDREQCDVIYACGVSDFNERSRRMFESLGFEMAETIELPAGSKANLEYDLVLTRDRYDRLGEG